MSKKISETFVLVNGKKIYPPEPVNVKHFSGGNPFKFGIDELNAVARYEVNRYSWCNGFYNWNLSTPAIWDADKDLRRAFKLAIESRSLKKGIEIASNALYIYSAIIYTETLRVHTEEDEWRRTKQLVCETAYFTKQPPRKDRKFSNTDDYVFERWMTWCWKDGESGYKDWWIFVRPDDSDVTLPLPAKKKRRNKKEDASQNQERFIFATKRFNDRNISGSDRNYYARISFYIRRRQCN